MIGDSAKNQLLDIIEALVYIVEDNRMLANMKIKAILTGFRYRYHRTPNFNLYNMTLRVRVKFRMMAAFMFSSVENFPYSESFWRLLHNYTMKEWGEGKRVGEDNMPPEYVVDFPKETEQLMHREYECILETEGAITLFPIEKCEDYTHLLMAFDLYRHLAHIHSFQDAVSKPYDENWLNVNPYQLPKGKSMLVDYFWTIPEADKPFFHKIMQELSGENIKSVDDLLRLRREVKEWQSSTP